MPLLLKQVHPASGARWVRDAFALYARRPFAFTMLFVSFLFGVLLLGLLPWVGGVLQMALAPMLTLGFMVACQSALLDGPVHVAQYIEPLRGPPKRRRALLQLCLIYAAAAVLIALVSTMISGDAIARMQKLMAAGNLPREEAQALMADSGLAAAMLLGVTLAALLSVPFWHAPALVYWGEQGVAQALFSSTLAVWRSKGAFFVYALTWVGVALATLLGATVLFLVLGGGRLFGLVLFGLLLFLCTVFYVSLLFTFNDSFGGAQPPIVSE